MTATLLVLVLLLMVAVAIAMLSKKRLASKLMHEREQALDERDDARKANVDMTDDLEAAQTLASKWEKAFVALQAEHGKMRDVRQALAYAEAARDEALKARQQDHEKFLYLLGKIATAVAKAREVYDKPCEP